MVLKKYKYLQKMEIGKNIIHELANHRHHDEFEKGYELCDKYKEFPVLNNSDIFKEFFAFFAFYTGKHEQSLQLYKQLQYFSQNKEITKLCDFNLKFPALQVIDAYVNYKPENVEKMIHYFNTPRPNPIITITTTTCKRLDLFKKTVNSFLECCLDLTKFEIDKWYVIDDNSSIEDFHEMQKLYPFITFIRKTPAQKGHARSINMLLNRVKTKYIFNLEDDWQFFHKDNYLTYLYEIINERDEIKQALLNNTYGEVLEKDKLVGGFYNTTNKMKLNYVEHEYAETENEKQLFNQKWGFHPNCSYWPHFSFRPGLTNTSIFTELGPFKENVWHFEMNYAYNYVQKGYKTCFLPGLVCKHIGKLTSDKDGINAYVLNDEIQFSGTKKITPIRDLDIVYVNLDRRNDRLTTFKNNMINLSTPIYRFSAIDGYALSVPLHPQLYHLFDKNDYNYRSGIVGCALSHISILIDFVNSPQSKKYLMIMEDDLYFNSEYHKNGIGFEDTLETCLYEMDKNGGDIMCLQYTKRNKNDMVNSNTPVIHKFNTREALAFSYGGTGCYVITKQGAIKLLDFINKNSMTNAIDTVIQKSGDELTLLYVEPLYVLLDMVSETQKVDTDIQYNYTHLNCSPDILIKTEIIWLYEKYNLRVDENYTITTLPNNEIYSYPLQNSWVNLKIQPSLEFKRQRPNQRLKVDDEFILNN